VERVTEQCIRLSWLYDFLARVKQWLERVPPRSTGLDRTGKVSIGLVDRVLISRPPGAPVALRTIRVASARYRPSVSAKSELRTTQALRRAPGRGSPRLRPSWERCAGPRAADYAVSLPEPHR
jgi:hypothetical protein